MTSGQISKRLILVFNQCQTPKRWAWFGMLKMINYELWSEIYLSFHPNVRCLVLWRGSLTSCRFSHLVYWKENKLIFQNVAILGLGLDDTLPENITKRRWKRVALMETFTSVSIPRYYFAGEYELFASRVRNINYMGFVTPQTTHFVALFTETHGEWAFMCCLRAGQSKNSQNYIKNSNVCLWNYCH